LNCAITPPFSVASLALNHDMADIARVAPVADRHPVIDIDRPTAVDALEHECQTAGVDREAAIQLDDARQLRLHQLLGHLQPRGRL
jgi:hypothetical protein